MQAEQTAGIEPRLRRHDVNHPVSIAALVALGVIGALGTFSFLPLVVGAAVDDLGLSERMAGLLASAEMTGAGLATLSMSFFIHRWNRRRIAGTGLVLIVTGSLLSLAVHQAPVLIGARGLTGLGEGAVVAAVIASMSGARSPERLFGLWTIFNMAMASLLFFFIMPRVVAAFGANGVFAVYSLLAAAGFVALLRYPRDAVAAAQIGTAHPVAIGRVAFALVAVLAAHVAHGGIWAYMERIGRAAGVDGETIGRVLGSAALTGLAGGLLVVVLGIRWGRTRPNALALALSIASLILVIHGTSTLAFTAAAILFYLAWVFGLSYLMGVIAALDPGGRSATAGVLMQNIGLAAGPALAGFIVAPGIYSGLAWFGLGLYGLALIVIVPLALSVDCHLADQPTGRAC